MKRLLLFLFLTVNIAAFCQEIDNMYRGYWVGSISLNGTKLELVFNISDKCTLDVPAQGAKGIPANFLPNEAGFVKIEVPTIRAYFEGMFLNKAMLGTFHQNGVKLPLTLSREDARTVNRPQNPVAPFPYNTEEVSFANGSAVLSGTLTTPADGNLDTPVVIMITGSGAQNRDEELYEHKPFAVIADAFARNGIATLRYDDRGFAKSTGDTKYATTDTLAADATAGIELLRKKGYKNVGALGHSEGGTIAFMLAADGLTDFVVSMAGAIDKGVNTLYSQVEAQALASGANKQQAEAYAQQRVNSYMAKNNAWINRFLELDPAEYIKRTECRVLAINGEKDVLVLADRHISLLQSILPSAVTKVYPNLNHMFQHCGSVLDNCYDIEETISPEVLQDIIDWICLRPAE